MAEELPKYPNITVIKTEDGWVKKEKNWHLEKEEFLIEAADHNNDGMIDYLRLQKPKDSYNHYVWLDTNDDGTFDKLLSIGNRGQGQKLKEKVKVPTLPKPTK